jgi:hypothetical protein
MPYKYKKIGDKYVVYKKDTGKRVGATAGDKESLRKYISALHINAKEDAMREAIMEAASMQGKQKLNEDDDVFQQKLQSIFKQNYQGFVAALGKFASDPKFRQFVKDTDENKSKVSLTSIPVTKLVPTQNEIDVDKSLAFPLTDAAAAAYALKGGAVKVASPIIVFNGKYIVDGHHRWSQLYAMNKDAKIVAYNFTNPDVTTPLDALKATQVAILGAGATSIPKATVEGKNLLKMDEATIKKYVIDKTVDPVVDTFNQKKQIDSKEGIADYIWTNVQSMQQTSQPVSGAPGRGVMPQADLGIKGDTGVKKTIATLQQGIPSLKEQELRKLIRREIKNALRETEASFSKKYDNDPALKGGQDKLPDELQKRIISKKK